MDEPRWSGIAWKRPAEGEEPGLAALDGRDVGGSALRLFLGPRSRFGARYFALGRDARPETPVAVGLYHSGPRPSYNWIELAAVGEELNEDERAALFRVLGEAIPPGGHLMVEYDSAGAAPTARALALGVPPLATSLGELLLEAGCGPAVRDWHISEGGREGPRKLQGFRPTDAAQARDRAASAVADLELFLARKDSSDPLLRAAFARARRILAKLRGRL